MKRFIFLFISILLLISFTSCSKKDNNIQTETTINNHSEQISSDTEVLTTSLTETTTYQQNTEITTQPQTEIQTQQQWTTAIIIDTYKKAATNTHGTAKLQQEITLTDISINNGEGAVNSVLKFVKPIISSVVSGSSTEIDGITGGYTQLIETDLKSAEAYTNGSKTIIKMVPKDQTDNSLVSEYHGTVGHLISVVGDNISGVFDQMSKSGLPIEISKEHISAIYVSPSVNVTINENGLIENGTWKYTVTITLSNFKVSGATVNNASVTMDNVLTLNGGFSE